MKFIAFCLGTGALVYFIWKLSQLDLHENEFNIQKGLLYKKKTKPKLDAIRYANQFIINREKPY